MCLLPFPSKVYRIYSRFTSQVLFTVFGGNDTNIWQQLQLTPASFGTSSDWTHLVFTFNLADANSSIIGYIDGVKCSVALGNATYTNNGTWTPITYYTHPTGDNHTRLAYGGGTSSNGMIYNNLAFFDDVLSDAQVAEIYNDGVPADLTGVSDHLLAWYNMGDGDTHPTINDSSGNDHHGTLYNGASSDFIEDVPG